MLNLMEYIEKDLPIIESYIGSYGIPLSDYIGSDTYFSNWASCKKKLFHLLNGQLIYEKAVNIQKDKTLLKQEVNDLRFKYIDFIEKIRGYIKEYYLNKNLISEIEALREFHSDTYWDFLDSLNMLFDTEYLTENCITKKFIFYNYKNKKYLKFDKGSKIIKIINKVLNFYDMMDLKYDDKDTYGEKFEKYRIEHSRILNEKIFKGTLCFSIHPLDFMTMSDNGYKWSSCMSWREDGCYHAGTVEMMNSNNVICVYLKGQESFCWEYRNKKFEWTNKKWRQLFYATKDIIVSGKAYPYASKELTFIALETLRELAKENWHHTYEFGIEPYKDMIHIRNMGEMVKNYNWIHSNETKKKNIIFHSKGMYNDMINDHCTEYYCIRNKVKKNTIITYSGKCNCIKCNNNVLDYNFDISDFDYESDRDGYDEYYNERYSNVGNILCNKCQDDYYCDSCQSYSTKKLYKLPQGERVCHYCLEDYEKISICPCCGEIFITKNFLTNEEKNPLSTLFVFEDPEAPIKEYLSEYYKNGSTDPVYSWWEYDFFKKYQARICDKCRKHIIKEGKVFSENIRYSPWSTQEVCIYKISPDEIKNYLKPDSKFTCKDIFGNKKQHPVNEIIDIEQFRIY